MGKRSNFERKPRDYYQTPFEAVKPLLPHLPDDFKCAWYLFGNEYRIPTATPTKFYGRI